MANRQARKKQQAKKKRLLITLIMTTILVIGIGGIGTWVLWQQQTTSQTPVVSQPQVDETKLTPTQVTTQRAAQALTLAGEYEELTLLSADAIAQVFTYAPISSETTLHATSYIMPERHSEYLEFLKTTLYFYYADLVKLYGESQLPQVATIEVGDVFAATYIDEALETTYTAYEVQVVWDYVSTKATIDTSQNWSNTATLTWIFDEELTRWYIVDIKAEYDEDIAIIGGLTTNVEETTIVEEE